MLFGGLLKERGGVIVSRRNSGFGDNLLAAANAWRYARATGRSLVILWTNSRYIGDPGENAFPRFFQVPESVSGVRVIVPPRADALSRLLLRAAFAVSPRPDARLFGARFLSSLGLDRGGAALKRESERREAGIDAVVNGLTDVRSRVLVTQGCYGPKDDLKPFFDAVRLAPRLAGIADDFAAGNFEGKKVTGAHVRYYGPHLPPSGHTPYWREWTAGVRACIDGMNKAREAAGGGEKVIFLSTDSRPVHEILACSLGGVVSYPKSFGSDFGGELHDELPVETAEASAIEMFLLARSDVLFRYPPGSWFSHYASLYAGRVFAASPPAGKR
ncbi:MAG: hypothetical protein IT344_09210 [Candidatus Dadabacteria bacterium]|nr:hypothetical protein [Candidatus Dadabacteria bacterium]